MINIKVVLVDDHKIFLHGVKNVLNEQDNIDVVAVFNEAKYALDNLKTNIPDLLITDISMPNLNGIEFVKKVKQLYPDLKILVVSMFKQIQSFNGIDGYLLKETSYEELIKAINTIVIDGEKYFYNTFVEKKETLEFNKTILTTREKEIVNLISKELTTDEIATKLFLSKHTVETHKKNIFQKLNNEF